MIMDYRQQGQGNFSQDSLAEAEANVNRRLDRLERQIERLDRRIDQLDRRVDRIERRLGLRPRTEYIEYYY